MTETDRKTGPFAALPAVLPLARRVVSYELSMWRSLYRWIFRRPVASGAGAQAFRYAATVTPLFIVFIAVSAIEIPILHLLLPWENVRRICDVLGVYGLLWMLGLLATMRVHPHVVSDSGLRIRHGATVDVTIPWDAIAAIRTRNRPATRRAVQFERTESGLVAHIAILSQTNVDVTLRRPTTVPLPKGTGEPITGLHFYADDPSALVARARECLTAMRESVHGNG